MDKNEANQIKKGFESLESDFGDQGFQTSLNFSSDPIQSLIYKLIHGGAEDDSLQVLNKKAYFSSIFLN